ncbi:MAG: toprim domain-containing protein, partial [Candidatus Latescibacteria bacterium]|nr:toprim domain-containing protein [Candidatus Latescibacterota bacterium]
MPGAIDKAIKEFSRLPGIGNKSAQRLVYFLLRGARAHADQLAAAINSLTADVHPCKVCGMLTELETCEICQDTRRDDGMICVVEESGDVPVVEASGRFRGRYHVLGGLISPINQVFPEQLNVAPLKTRASGVATEVILALSASSDGEYTSRSL